MVNWKQKLSSRKFWIALIGFVSAMMFAFNFAEADIEKVTSVIMAGATLITYILTEGYVDAHRDQEIIVIDEEIKK